MRRVHVPLGERSYDIRIGPGLLAGLGQACRRLGLGRRCALITDSNVARWYARPAAESLAQAGFEPVLVTMPAGEQSKSLKRVESCYDLLARHRLERGSFVVALGGGVVGDLGGFVAATYLRGIAYVQVPTSLLAQVDSSVGGKTGVNLRSGKNLVGSFYQPRLVLCDLDTLRTLPGRELRAGLAEVIKYGIIYDRRFFVRLEKQLARLMALEETVMASVVARCCEIKAEVVGQDEKEGGLRAILNFGHTIGHAIETSVGYGRYLHGEAIAIGQVAAGWLSVEMLGLARQEVERMRRLFEQAELPTSLQLGSRRREKLLAAMTLDKKVQGGEVRFVLAEQIGRVRFGQRVPARLVKNVLDKVQASAAL